MAPVYVLDACVLYPVVLRDLLLTLSVFDAFEVRWTESILEEMTRNVRAKRPDVDPARFDERVVGSMRTAFPKAVIDGYEHLVDTADNHPKDRHVAAAALHVNADAIVTYNVRDFGGEVLGHRGVAVVTPPDVLGQLIEEEPSVVALAIRAMAARKQRPPMTPAEVVAAVARQLGFSSLMGALGGVDE